MKAKCTIFKYFLSKGQEQLTFSNVPLSYLSQVLFFFLKELKSHRKSMGVGACLHSLIQVKLNQIN